MRSNDNKINKEINKLISNAVADATKRAEDALYGIARRAIGTAENSAVNVRTRQRTFTEGYGEGKTGSKTVTVKSFYGDYTPKVYKRTGNLENSFRTYTKKFTDEEFLTSLYFSPDYMPFATYTYGGAPYDKEAVMEYAYEQGWHGRPAGLFAKGKGRSTKKKKRERAWGETYRSQPAPAEVVEKEVAALTIYNLLPPDESNDILNELYAVIEEELFNKLDVDFS